MNKNTKVFGAIGCGLLTAILAVAIAIVACAVSIVWFGFSSVKNSEPYQLALTTAQESETAVSILGDPIEPGFFFSGSFNTSGDEGDAQYSIPISGPNGKGELHAVAYKENGVWELTSLILEANSERVSLIRER